MANYIRLYQQLKLVIITEYTYICSRIISPHEYFWKVCSTHVSPSESCQLIAACSVVLKLGVFGMVLLTA